MPAGHAMGAGTGATTRPRDDAVPSPSLDTAYPPMSVRPLAVGENTDQNNIESTNTPAAAYMTSSSVSNFISLSPTYGCR